MQRYSKYKESVWESGDVRVVRTRETKTAIRGEFSGICSKFEQWFNMRRRRGREDYRYKDTKFKLVSDNRYKKDFNPNKMGIGEKSQTFIQNDFTP